MQARIRYLAIIIVILHWARFPVSAQELSGKLSGIVYDSLTLAPLSYVTVINETTNTGTATDESGLFKLAASPGDSILFTMLGYSRKRKVLRIGENTTIIFLREFALTLQSVTIYGSYKPQGADQWKSVIEMPKVFRNPAGPGSGYLVETFGPGVSISGLLSRMTKSEKEKRKVKTVREKAKHSETFLSVIVSEETKEYFQKTFSLTTEEYNKFIESFNQAHPEAVYIERKEDIMNLMVSFMAMKK